MIIIALIIYPFIPAFGNIISAIVGSSFCELFIVELFELFGGKVMDTPGFSSLEFKNYSKEDIRNAFIEFKSFPCPFSDCNHTNEEECLVKKAVKDNNILESRYLNYLSFIKEDKK